MAGNTQITMKIFLNKKIVFSIAFLLGFVGMFTGMACLADNPETVDSNGVRFNWAFGAWVQSDSGRSLISVGKDMPLRTGDRLKFFLQPVSGCHIYLIYYGSQGEMHLLFPTQTSSGNQAVSPSIPHLIPEGMDWFSIDNQPGLERFYLLASVEPLSDLENLLMQLKNSTPPDRDKLIQEIRTEIKRLKREHRKLAAAAERPMSIGGTVRSLEPDTANAYPDVKKLANQISAEKFFSRTFTIEHE